MARGFRDDVIYALMRDDSLMPTQNNITHRMYTVLRKKMHEV